MDTVNTAQAAEALAGPHLSRPQAKGWLHRLIAGGVIPPLGRSDGKGTWALDRRAVIIAAVLRPLHEWIRISDAARLRAAYTLLSGPAEGETGPALIDAILADIEAGALPVLAVTLWHRPADGAICTHFAVRLGAEFKRPLVAPEDDVEPVWHGVLELAPLLRRFVDNADNVIPLHKAGA